MSFDVPSAFGPKLRLMDACYSAAVGEEADMRLAGRAGDQDPEQTLAAPLRMAAQTAVADC